jgi:hypothetical protein
MYIMLKNQKVPFMAAAVMRSHGVPFPIGQRPVVLLSLWSAWTRPSACSQTSRTQTLHNLYQFAWYLAQIYRPLHILTLFRLTLWNFRVTICITSFNTQKHCILHTECTLSVRFGDITAVSVKVSAFWAVINMYQCLRGNGYFHLQGSRMLFWRWGKQGSPKSGCVEYNDVTSQNQLICIYVFRATIRRNNNHIPE